MFHASSSFKHRSPNCKKLLKQYSRIILNQMIYSKKTVYIEGRHIRTVPIHSLPDGIGAFLQYQMLHMPFP